MKIMDSISEKLTVGGERESERDKHPFNFNIECG